MRVFPHGLRDVPLTVRDSHGETFTSDDLTEVARWASRADDPMIDLVTDLGEGVGLYVAGSPDVVEPQPSLKLEGGMIFMIDGDPLLKQPAGFHLCPLSAFLDKGREADSLDDLTWYTPAQLNIVTPGSIPNVVLMTGRSRQEGQGKWKPITSTFAQFSAILLDHKVGEKNGTCFLQGESADGARKSSAQIANHILGVDLDSGAPLNDVMATIQKHGLEAVIYTTHSHLKDTSEIKRDHFMKKMDANVADLELLKRYLIERKGVLPHIVKKLEVLDDAKHTAEGVVILVRHEPIPKFRAVFSLSEPFIFAKRGGSQQDAINEWKERYAGFCTDMGFFFDEKCVDPARLFYLPRHKNSNSNFGSWRIAGNTLDLDKFSRVKISRNRRSGAARGPQNAFTAAAIAAGANDYDDDPDRYITDDGFNLRRWSAKFAKHFEIQTMLDTLVGGDFIREPRPSGKPGVQVECPFEAEHTTLGGSGTFVVNAGDNYADGFEGGFTFNCQHAACNGRDRLDFLKELLENEIISEAGPTQQKLPARA
ncbi:hypothetical protein SAMN05428950_103390 [Sphingomonas sp. OV641]|nr:hypothetical protein SAMN05428950_103390 [Sphingomonas sp. OV641]